jgi:hypothetical protein
MMKKGIEPIITIQLKREIVHLWKHHMLLNWSDSNPTAKPLCPLLGGCWMGKFEWGDMLTAQYSYNCGNTDKEPPKVFCNKLTASSLISMGVDPKYITIRDQETDIELKEVFGEIINA